MARKQGMTPGKRLIVWVFRIAGFILKLLYGFRIEGVENLPREGPYIAVYNEFSLLGSLADGVATIRLLLKYFLAGKLLAFVGEDLLAMPLASTFTRLVRLFPLLPHGAGLLGLHLLDGLDVLQDGGVVIINPEGDMSRDGRPLPIRGGAAWLGLHSAAPLVPIIVSAGAYDVWPPWKLRPSWRGRFVQRVGKPFKLAETPAETISDEDLAAANARIRAEIDKLWFGPGGVAEYTGLALRHGVPVEPTIRDLPVPQPIASGREVAEPVGPIWNRGIPLLLWRCPVCHTNDALIHRRRPFRAQTVDCRACGTCWAVHRVPERDFRLEVIDGPVDWVGLDMALSVWYDVMKRELRPSPVGGAGPELLPGEELYLRTDKAMLYVYRSSALVQGWAGREPPRRELPERGRPPEIAGLGTGALYLTSRRLVWEGPQGGLDFWWPSVTDVSLRLYYVLGINFGTAPYRFILTHDNGLKWLTYAGTVIREALPEGEHKVTLSPF